MSSYFDAKNNEVCKAWAFAKSDREFLDLVGEIEQVVIKDVMRVTGDREFPDDLRERMLNTIAIWGTRAIANVPNKTAEETACALGYSTMIEELHSAFHTLAGRRVQTRFGVLFDNPGAIWRARDAHDDPCPDPRHETPCSRTCPACLEECKP